MAESPMPFKDNNVTTLGEIIDNFGSNTTAHGIPRIISATKFLSRVFWTLICLGAFSLFITQSITLLEDYLAYPTTTKVDLVPKSMVPFPSITICNMNRLRRSALTGTRFEDIITIDGGFDEDYTAWFGSDVFYGSESAPQTSNNVGGSVPQQSDDVGGLASPPSDDVGGLASPPSNDVGGLASPSSNNVGGSASPSSGNVGGSASPSSGNVGGSASPSSGNIGGSASPSSGNVGGSASPSSGNAGGSASPSSGGNVGGSASPSSGNVGGSASPSSDINRESTSQSSDGGPAPTSPSQTDGGGILRRKRKSLRNIRDAGSEQSSTDATMTGDAPTTGDDTPMTEDDAPMTGDDAPMTEDDAPMTGDDAPMSGDDAPMTGDDAPMTGDDAPMTGDDASMTGDDAPMTGDASMTGDDAPMTGDASMTGDDAPMMGDASMMGDGSIDTGSFRNTGTSDTGFGASGNFGGGSYGGGYYGYADGSYYWNDFFDFSYYGEFDFQYDDYYDWGDITDANDWRGIYDNSRTEDYSDIMKALSPTKEELREYGHQADDFILQCSYNKRKCNYTDFLQFQNLQYGNCYTFNHGINGDVLRQTSQTGAQSGLQLTLLIEQPEYIGLLSHDVGVRVSVHHPTIAPHPEDTGISAETGTATSIGLRQNEIYRLDGKYGNCSNSHPEDNSHGGMYHFDYSSMSCKKLCVQGELSDKCGCVTDIYIDDPKCDFLNKTQQACQQIVETLATEDKLDCNCPLRCQETNYFTSISTSLWPSERYQDHLYLRVSERNFKAANIIGSFEKTRKNLVRLNIFFEELNFQSINEVPIYSTASLLGSLGGLLGLYIGLSTITMVEIIILFIDIIAYALRKMFCRNRVMALN